jgi:hypothetical protein
MWYEGTLQRWEELPDQGTIDFFEKNENIVPDFTGVDDPSILHEWKVEGDPDYIMDNTQLPWIEIDGIEIPHKDIFEEANHLLYTSCYTLHRPMSSGWLSLAIHGMSSVHTNVPEDYGLPDEAEYTMSDWTDIAKFAPKTKQWLMDEVRYTPFSRVRFMAVLPGGWLAQHRDRHRTTGVGATNVAINTPDGCAMVMGGWGIVPQPAGTMIKLNTGYEHAVWNRSEEPRIHMILDGDPSDYFKEKVNQGYARMLGA